MCYGGEVQILLSPRTAYKPRGKEVKMPNNNGGNLGSGTVAGLMAFLDWVVRQNYATPSTITPLKSAAKQVFETVEGDGKIDGVDVRSLDVGEYFGRFQVAMKASGRINPDSVRAYRNRFGRALELYNDYLTTGDKPKLRSRTTSRPRRERAARPSPSPASGTAEPAADVPSSNMISYPFPLESGEVANLRLPKRLERRDAARLTTFINALTFDPQKQLGTGSDDDPEPLLH
jgi:hypothetical protein